ncbi:MAG TPA: hypothetical protein VND64_11700 [Pirellulales bacterium]|nr:hypothetical protein [Pirellulales bacterium]
MSPATRSVRPVRPSAWWLVLGLVGLDYFSTLAYLPSIMADAAGPLAPLAAVLLVLVTMGFAVPVYAYVVGRSPHGQGATALFEQTVAGWRGKLLLLVLMGFVAADFVVTRSLSVADASTHVLHNPHWHAAVDRLGPGAEAVRESLGPWIARRLEPIWTRQMGLTLGLALLAFAFLWLLHRGFTHNILRLAAVTVAAYLLLAGMVVGSGLAFLALHPQLVEAWWQRVLAHGAGAAPQADRSLIWRLLFLSIRSFPQMALAISGFELSMTVAPLVRGKPGDDPDFPRGRIRDTRKLMVVAGLIMAIYVVGSVTVTTLLVPVETLGEGGAAQHRTLAYLAHGGQLTDGRSAMVLSGLFGDAFGSLYDAVAVVVLCLAGASGMIALRDLVPQFLHRMGMEMDWALRFGVMMHLFNAIILVVTVVFHASVSDQQGAYATSVLALLTGTAFAALLDLGRRWRGSKLRPVVVAPFGLIFGFFLAMLLLSIVVHRSGLVIALSFVATVLFSSAISRWARSTELRFVAFEFDDERSRARWEEIRRLEFQVLVPHRPGLYSLAEKDHEVRCKHRITADAYLVFVEVFLGDPSNFHHQPLMRIERDGELEVIRVSRAASVSHVIAAIGLEFCSVGRPPEIIFGWSQETPLAANLNFLLLGEGNIPWMVQALVSKTKLEPDCRPRVVVG